MKSRLSSWLTLGCITLLQALSAPRFIFSACSSLMEQNYHISHVQLNNVIVASETGRLFGFVSTAAATCFPAWMILFIGLVSGLVGYGVQCLCISHRIPALSFWQALLLSALAGNSSCWINTYCQLLATRNFKNSYRTIIDITSAYSGLSAKILTSVVEGIEGRKGSTNSSIYLLLTCLVPAAAGLLVALIHICLEFMESGDSDVFPAVFVLIIATGVYTVIESVATAYEFVSSQLRAVILVLVLAIPFAIALLTAAADGFSSEKYHSGQVTRRESNNSGESNPRKLSQEVKIAVGKEGEADQKTEGEVGCNDKGLFINDPGMKQLLLNVDFWMFYLVNACGPTLDLLCYVPLVYKGKISDSQPGVDNAPDDPHAHRRLLAPPQQQMCIHQHRNFGNLFRSLDCYKFNGNVRAVRLQEPERRCWRSWNMLRAAMLSHNFHHLGIHLPRRNNSEFSAASSNADLLFSETLECWQLKTIVHVFFG
ncbi:hypothetical protein DKX38_019864 [Salix brachista]|uniref:Nodulin-like domain-containing protein n=1 Tax=Salix brachista TaxID=2182728 RepID=A0A5N5KHC7_9ROSI|nr:hypothetical protein DKX38_019864 [Salix brachista]